MGRHKKYPTANAMRKAIDKYLRSIQTLKKTGLVDLDGNEIVLRVYVVPPELKDIEHAIGIHRDTWNQYARGVYGEDYAEVCQDAKDECERWLVLQLNTREKSVDGIKRNLEWNYGWGGSKHEVEMGESTRKALEAASLTMEEKLERLASMPELTKLFGIEEDGTGPGESDDAE